MTQTLLLTCKPSFEKMLAREIALDGFQVKAKGVGWSIVEGPQQVSSQQPLIACFAQHVFANPILVSGASVNDLSEKLITQFISHLGQTRITEPWPFYFSSFGNDQFLTRAKTVKSTWQLKLKKRMSHVAKLSKDGIVHSLELVDGFYVHFIDFNQAYVSFKALCAGQQRMQMDQRAPSRSYLKLEEAFVNLGLQPKQNETVVDLGAAPGGWSYSALKRGATVTAIDNGPLKEPVKSHANIVHLQVDAIKYRYEQPQPADWLLCDILQPPELTIDLVHRWLTHKWCRHFIVNLKVGRTDPIVLIKKVRDAQKGLLPLCHRLLIRQLYHDREELTLMGQTKK